MFGAKNLYSTSTPKKPLQNLQNPTKQGFFEPAEAFWGCAISKNFWGPNRTQITLQDHYFVEGFWAQKPTLGVASDQVERERQRDKGQARKTGIEKRE